MPGLPWWQSASCWVQGRGSGGAPLRSHLFPWGAFFFFNKFIYFIYLFLAALGLHCCKWGLLFVAVHGLLIAVASLVVEHGF